MGYHSTLEAADRDDRHTPAEPYPAQMPVSYLVEKLSILGAQGDRLARTDGFIPTDDLAVRIIRLKAEAILTELDTWVPVRTVALPPTPPEGPGTR